MKVSLWVVGNRNGTYVVAGLLIFIALFVGLSLIFIWTALRLAQCLPPLSEQFSNLSCRLISILSPPSLGNNLPNEMPGFSSRTTSRCSLAKNMYADKPRLGALGSDPRRLAGTPLEWGGDITCLTLLFLLHTTGLALASGSSLFLRHVEGSSRFNALERERSRSPGESIARGVHRVIRQNLANASPGTPEPELGVACCRCLEQV